MEPALDPQQQADNDALASAVGAAAHQLGLDDHAHAHAHSHPHSIPHSVAHSQTHSHVGTPTQADEDNAFLAHQLQQPEYGGSGVGHGHGHGHGKEGSAGIGVGVGVGVGVGLADDSGQHGHVDLDLANIDLPLEHNLAHGQQQHAHMNQSFHIPSPPMMHQHHNQHQQQHQQLQHDQPTQSTFVRPPSIRKACDLCHAAKQKCSGDRPTCTRCLAGGWQCHYAPRQRRRTVPKESRSLGLGHGHHLHGHGHSHGGHNTGHGSGTDGEAMSPGAMGSSATAAKKRKLEVRRNSLTFENGLDLKTAMGMALDMGMANEDEGEEILNMSNEAMASHDLEVIAVDGYIADLPLATFVNNLPYTAPPAPPQLPSSGPPSASASASATHPPIGVGVGVGLGGGGGNGNGGVDDYGADSFQGADMDQHTTSALRDAIFSLNNDGVGVGVGVGVGMDSGGNDNGVGNGDGVSVGLDDGTDIDPHLALLDLSHIAEDGEGLDGLGLGGEHGQNDHSHGHGHAHGETDHAELLSMHLGCNHPEMVPHLLALLVQHPLDPKPHANTPLTMPILAPLARAIRTFHNIANCPACMSSPQQTLPQLALISRLSTILTFPFPPTNSGQIPGAQIVLHGARLTGTGISDSIEQHIVHVVWDSWRASIREVFMIFERQARDVIASSAAAARDKEDKKRADGGDAQDREQQGYPKPIVSSVEIQRAGLFFQAMSRLKQAMEEVEME